MKFKYYCSSIKDKDNQLHDVEIEDERVQADEWLGESRLGGVPPIEPDTDISKQVHYADNCTDKCNRPEDTTGRIHKPAGAPPPYWFCEQYEDHKGWATLTPIQVFSRKEHVVERTSNPGEPYEGKCINCGVENLSNSFSPPICTA